jgi:hypothetical protein
MSSFMVFDEVIFDDISQGFSNFLYRNPFQNIFNFLRPWNATHYNESKVQWYSGRHWRPLKNIWQP